ncbi:hypothetical protein BDV98DRAFT_217283 [Pterulicium gracile]|uniref:Uncharacterized protein n=1 Tax=Pterulicium gracile TaxID=1884261 RepID=A0A5C3QAH5_9AGAR|nr:hypothetical protein BDV98DRAFT_217283 [Pterula gracilis]
MCLVSKSVYSVENRSQEAWFLSATLLNSRPTTAQNYHLAVFMADRECTKGVTFVFPPNPPFARLFLHRRRRMHRHLIRLGLAMAVHFGVITAQESSASFYWGFTDVCLCLKMGSISSLNIKEC